MNKHTFNRMTIALSARLDKLPPADELRPEHDIEEDLEVDSLDRIDMAMACEVTFDVKFDMDRLKYMKTLKDLCEEVERLQHGNE